MNFRGSNPDVQGLRDRMFSSVTKYIES